MRCARSFARLFTLLAVVCAPACGVRDDVRDDRRVDRSPAPTSANDSTPAPSDTSGPRIVLLGDSLTAGYGLPLKQAYPTLLKERLDDAGLNYTIVNAGNSGDTSAGGLSRLDWALDGDVRVLIVALGGNDGLRGLPPEELTRNLSAIIERAQAHGIAVILAGMEAPPNFGRAYTSAFHQVYPTLARKYHIALIPFLLEGVAGSEALNQPDGIHPTATGARMVADNVWAVLKPIVERDARRVVPRSPSE